jgi:hypothetical protein
VSEPQKSELIADLLGRWYIAWLRERYPGTDWEIVSEEDERDETRDNDDN